MPEPGSQAWLDQVSEEIVDPEREIVDPHHHLWTGGLGPRYMLDELWSDTDAGHRVTRTVFMECRSFYREDGPEELRCVGETETVAEIAAASEAGKPEQARIRGIVSHADLRYDGLEEVLAAHEEAGRGLFRGIRHAGSRDEHPEALRIPGRAPAGLYADPDFVRGVRTLGRLGYTYDTWQYHHQLAAFETLARACPDTVMVLDHFSTPLGVGPYAGRRDEIFETWKRELASLAGCPNVRAKLGGMAMPDNGFGWHERDRPPTSDEFVAAQERWYHHAIECFGPERCMFESNFPVDRWSISYPVLWNGLKKIAGRYGEADRERFFSGTASEVYRV